MIAGLNASIGICLVAGFLIAAFGGAALLPLLRRSQFREHAYEDASATHQKKSGTPTMGGIVFVLALVPMLSTWSLPFAAELLLLVVACAAVGFIDDFLAIRGGRNRGLRARTKFLATALIAIMFLRHAYDSYAFFPRDVLFHAGTYALNVPHWLWLLLGIVAITGTIHAVNLTDGLDGLATGTMMPALAVFAAIGFEFAYPASTEAALLGLGACAGFLIYNRYPAKVFMGDTGCSHSEHYFRESQFWKVEMLLLIVVGAIFAAEALSVILQVTYFKLSGGKRIFRMSPLHHHFELSGWPETKVTARFWLASVACAVLAWAIVR